MAIGETASRGVRVATASLAATLLAITGCTTALEPMEPGSFYRIAADRIGGAPGTILRSEQMAGAPAGTSAYRVLYRSTGLKDEPIAVSGIVVVPEGVVPDGGRPVIAWAHPTTGVANRCAPTLTPNVFKQIQGLPEMLALGYVVAATDYPGLGTPGTHPYLVGVSEGRAVLDSVRAARNLAEAQASGTFAVWGHSQGGQASLYAGQLARTYAPDLKLAGVAAAAPATDLAQLLRDDIGTKGGKVLTAYALWSWNRVYDAPLGPVLDPAAKPTVDAISADCIENLGEDLAVARLESRINTNFLHGDVTEIEPWKTLLAQNATGGAPAGAPVFLAQGTADETVRPQVTFQFAKSLCETGTPVRFDWLPGVNHDRAAAVSAPTAVEWMQGRIQGLAAPNDCRRLPPPPNVASSG
ncbi:lipase family protein [Microbaculum marinum]|uniref:Lipase family protein n=1 Tax=Microbaculum marinum TaxID=1764581 RepID=A0AAW9RT95_9HYPH